MNTSNVELTILMPCLNEELTLVACITKALNFLKQNNITGEVLIADNGSTDSSIQLAESLGARVVNIKERGYGSALLGGIKAAKGVYVIMGDSDDSYDFSDLTPFVNGLRNGYDLVIGNRFKGGVEKGAMPFLHRYLGNPVLSFIGKLFFNIPVNDFHCGLRGVNKERILAIGLSTPGMEFASEMIVKSALNNFSIQEVATTLKKDGRNRKPHLNTWRDGWRHLRFLLMYSPKWLFLYPGVLIAIVGFILSIVLIITPVQVYGIRLDIHTLLYSTFITISGIQLIYFYLFSRVFGYSTGLFPQAEQPKIISFVTLEKGVAIGGLLLLTGFVLSGISLLKWGNAGFGDLIPSHTFRIVIPAVGCLILGVQFLQNSFFLSLLQLQNKRQ